MSESSDPFESPRTLLEWAKADNNELEKQFREFVDANLTEDIIEYDPVTRIGIRKIKIRHEPPTEWRRIAYQSALHIRSALDHVVAAGIVKLSRDYPDKMMLPFSSNPRDLDARLIVGKVPTEFHPLIKQLQPYPTGQDYEGGDNILCALNRVANINKHVSTLGIGCNIGEMVINNINIIGNAVVTGTINRENKTIELFKWIGEHDIRYDSFIPISLQFSDLGHKKGGDYFELTQHCGQKAEEFLTSIEALCS